MMQALPELPEAVANLAYQHAVVGDWPRFRDYLRANGVESIEQRRAAFEAAGIGHLASRTTPQQVAAAAAHGFPDLACMECAASVREALERHGMSGTVLDLSTGKAQGMYGHIWSDRLGELIAHNGRHRAVRIDDTVFDNHNPKGTPFEEWRRDLVSPGFPDPGTIPLQETDF
jgi:hypothetical protein